MAGSVQRWSFPRAVFLAFLAMLVLTSPACVERYLVLQTEPPGADVYINGRHAGRSPVEEPFTYYGTYRVDVYARYEEREMRRFGSWSGELELEPPWYQVFPLDFFAELVDPRVHVDRHTERVVLPELPVLEAPGRGEETWSRAGSLRDASR